MQVVRSTWHIWHGRGLHRLGRNFLEGLWDGDRPDQQRCGCKPNATSWRYASLGYKIQLGIPLRLTLLCGNCFASIEASWICHNAKSKNGYLLRWRYWWKIYHYNRSSHVLPNCLISPIVHLKRRFKNCWPRQRVETESFPSPLQKYAQAGAFDIFSEEELD